MPGRYLVARLISLALLSPLCLSVSAANSAPETFADLPASQPYRNAWARMLAPEKAVPSWLRRGRAVSGPFDTVQIAGKTYVGGHMCKPHDCGANQFFGLFDEAKRNGWGLLVTVKDTPKAIDAPSKYATYRWFGKPDETIKAHLLGQLKQDPNWK